MSMISLRLLLAIILGAPMAAVGQPSGLFDGTPARPKSQEVQASLVAGQTALVPGQPLDVALKLVHPPHWHTYWLNPGIGTPTQLKWELPEGWTSTALIWPVPLVKPTELGNQHIYEGTVWLFTTVTPPLGLPLGTEVTLKAAAKWLVCDEGSLCMPGGAALNLTLPVAAQSPAVPAVIAELAAVKAAQPITTPAWEVKLEPKWTLTLTPKEGANPDPGEVYFFDEKKAIALDPQQAVREGGVIRIDLKANEDAEADAMPSGFIHASKGWLKDGSAPALALTTPNSPAARSEATPQVAAPVADTPAPPLPAPTTPAPAPAAAVPFLAKVTFWPALFALFAAGIVLNVMPCVFPVLALKVLGFVQQAGKDPKETRRHSYAYAVGLLVFVWLVAGGMMAANHFFGAELAWGDITRYSSVLAIIVIILHLLALNLAGLFEMGTSLTSVGGKLQDKEGYAGSFWSGALTMVVSTPCSGPLMAGAMGYTLKQPPIQQFVLFTAFGLGIALPYVVLSCSPQLIKKLPRPGAWMETFKKSLSFPMFGAAIFFFNAFITKTGTEGAGLLLWAVLAISIAAWIYGHWCVPSRPTRPRLIGAATALLAAGAGGWLAWLATLEKTVSAKAPHVIGGLEWTSWSPEALAAERAKGRAVFVNYTTINCYTCEVNEKRVFRSDAFTSKIRELNIAPLRAKYLADGTPEDDAIRDSLKPWEISTFPAYIMYPADPAKPPVLVGDNLLGMQHTLDALEQATK